MRGKILTENEIATEIVDAAVKVHKALGPGLLESVYEVCLCHELRKRGLSVDKQYPVPVIYEGEKMETGFRIDIWVEKKVVIEIKTVKALDDVHLAQTLTYLKLTNNKLGILLNFNVALMKQGIKRVVNNLE